MAVVAYRLTVYAPRSVDATEATVLVPRAGADHTDAFKVATVQGVPGFQPYLTGIPKGRRSTIDPLERKTDIGMMTFSIGDRRLSTGNLSRWVTSFYGNAAGEDQLKGCKVFAEENLAYDPLNPTLGWNAWWTGRTVQMQLNGRTVIDLVAHEMTDDLSVDVFVGAPAASVASYAFIPQVFPIGLRQPYASFPLVADVSATVSQSVYLGPPPNFASLLVLSIDRDQANLDRLVTTQQFLDAMGDPDDGLVHVNVGGVWSTWYPSLSQGSGTSVESLAMYSLFGVDQHPPAVGTKVTCYVTRRMVTLSDTMPLMVNDVHPVTYIRHLLSGAYGRLDANGNALWSAATEPTSFATLEADTSFLPWRTMETEKKKLNEAIEEVCKARSLAYYTDELGRIVIADMRRASAVPQQTLLSADTVASQAPEWKPDASRAISSVTSTIWVEKLVPTETLPQPFQNGSQGNTSGIDIPVCRVQAVDDPIRLQQGGPRVADVKGSDFTLEHKGDRYAMLAAGKDSFTAESYGGRSRDDVLRDGVTALVSELRAPFALGPVFATISVRRAAAVTTGGKNLMPGMYVVVQVDELPDPASNRRGGARLALITQRTENGPYVDLQLLDCGANSVAVTPVLGVPAAIGGQANAAQVTVTLNAAGDPVRLQMALTDTTVSVTPATGWTDVTPGGTLVTASGAVGLVGVPRGKRMWLRGRSEPGAGQSFKLPSAWANAGAPGYVNLTALTAPSALVASDTSGYADITWTPGDATLREDVFITLGGVPGTWTDAMRVVRLDPGSSHWRIGPLALGSSYTIGVQAVDDAGSTSVMATVAFTCGTAPALLAPYDPTAFAGSHNRYGLTINDGTYGLAVAAAEYPGEVEFAEAIETAPGSAVFGAFAAIGRVGAIQGDWTKTTRRAPSDGLRRQLKARSARQNLDGTFTYSPYTDAVTVMPYAAQELPAYATTVQRTGILRITPTESSDGTLVTLALKVGSSVDHVQAYYRTVASDAPGDVADFTDTATLPIDDKLFGYPTAGAVSFTFPQPARGRRLITRLVPSSLSPAGTFSAGESIVFPVNPAPPAINVDIIATRSANLASLTVEARAGVSDLPGTLEIIETVLGVATTLVKLQVTAGLMTAGVMTLDPGGYPALGGRVIAAGVEAVKWRAVFTDVSGQAWTFDSAPALPALVLATVNAVEDATARTATITATLTDPGHYLNPAAKDALDSAIVGAVTAHTTLRGVTQAIACTSIPVSGTTGDYVFVIPIDPTRPIMVTLYRHYVDGSTDVLWDNALDSNKISDVRSAVPTNSGTAANVFILFDNDTAIGASCGQYSLNAGATWTPFTVAGDYTASLTGIARTTAVQSMIIQGKNAIDGLWGNPTSIPLAPYTADVPSLTAQYKPLTSTTGQIVWTCTLGIVTVSIDGGTAATPSASPIPVTLDGSTHDYAFVATLGSQTISRGVSVPSIAGGASINGVLSNLTNSLASTGNPGHLTFAWSSNGFGAGVQVEVWVMDPGKFGDTNYHLDGSTTIAAGTYAFTAGESLSTNLSPKVTIGFSLRAFSGAAYGSPTVPVEADYGSP